MKLLEIISPEELSLDKLTDTYWVLDKDYSAKFVTDCGTYHLSLTEGWVTDKRSGSDVINPIVPKWSDNKQYQACIAAHDCSYSGWVSKSLADDLFILQGLCKSGEIGHIRSSLAYYAVSSFGTSGYYHMDDDLPYPYYDNRKHERLVLLDR